MSDNIQNQFINFISKKELEKKGINENNIFLNLNKNQKDAVSCLDGPLLVLSGAGTGKTRVLTSRLANLLKTGKARPSNILAVTFTNKAAKEMRNRLELLIGPDANSLWLGTFHSIAARILRQYAEIVGLKSNFTIINPDDQKKLLKELIVIENLDEKKITPQYVAHLINSWKDKGLSYGDIEKTEKKYLIEGKAGKLFDDYQKRLLSLNCVDFADLLLHNLVIFRQNRDILEKFQKNITHFLIDEYQDTNTAQYLWLKLLVNSNNNICCVGDDDQSIYGWRGADIGNILRFEKDFSGAEVIRLEENYRSSKYILNSANNLISFNQSRLGKSLKTSATSGEKITLMSTGDGAEEARKISTHIENLLNKGVKFNEIAVLVRAGYQTRNFEERFVQIGLPYKVIGAKFYERQEIRDAIAYFRVILQQNDDLALERIINVPKRGIGSQTLRTIKKYSRLENISIFNGIEQLILTDELRPGVKISLESLIKQFYIWQEDIKNLSHTDLAGKVLEESGYVFSLQNEKSIDAENRLENLKELINAMASFENLAGFIEHISLVNDGENSNIDGEISLMTLHAAKGLEFDAVFLPCWEEGSFPSQRSIDEKGIVGLEEERRLAYVGITRAKKYLIISFASQRIIHGLWQSVIPSRFVDELPTEEMNKVTSTSVKQNFNNDYFEFDFNQDLNLKKINKANNFENNFKNNINGSFDIQKPYEDRGKIFQIGERVFHEKFGMGKIITISDNKANVEFDKAGNKNVITNFLNKK